MISNKPKPYVYTNLITPFNSKLDVDFEIIRQLIKFQASNEVDGIAICGEIGESPSLISEEVIKIAETIDQSRKNTKRKLDLLITINKSSIISNVEIIKETENFIDAYLISAPLYPAPLYFDGLIKYFLRMINSINKPFFIYNLPEYTGFLLSDDIIKKIMTSSDQFMGIIEFSDDINHFINLINTFPEFKIIIGHEKIILDGLRSGTSGIISSISNIFPNKIKDLINEIESNNLDKATNIQNELNAIQNLIKSFPPIASLKTLLNMKEITGFKSRVRPPLIDLNNEQELELFNKINRI
jgi:4-hydroxy-tetrahydrodipicolinate synthase